MPRGDRAHAYLWRRLCNCSEARVQIAGSDLNSLRGDRNKADYELEHTLVHRQALLQVACAERIMQSLRAATQEPAQSKIREAMKVYERDVLKDVSWRP